MATTTMQTAASGRSELMSLLEKSKQQIAMALPRHLNADRMIRVAMTAFSRTPQLQECSVISIVGCVIQASELGLELTGPLGQAYMVPRWNKNTRSKEANFQVGYRGLVDLGYRSGRLESFPAHVVYENDLFSFQYGTKPHLKHVPTEGEPGAIRAFYAVINMKGGASDFEVMTVKQIESHRDRYADKQSIEKGYSPWVTAFEEMGKKTVVRRLAKRCPMSIEFQKAVAVDEYNEAGVTLGSDNFVMPVQSLEDRIAGQLPANGNGKHAEPKVEEQPSHDWQAEGDAEAAAEPAKPVEDEAIRKATALDDIKAMLSDAFGDDSKSIAKVVGDVFKVKGFSAIERWNATQLEKAAADLKAHID